jgi:regulator of replication initiation timing
MRFDDEMHMNKTQRDLAEALKRNRELATQVAAAQQPLHEQVHRLTVENNALRKENEQLTREIKFATEAFENICALSMARSGRLR